MAKIKLRKTDASDTLTRESLATWSKTWLPGFVRPDVSSFREVLRPQWANTKTALALAGIGGSAPARVLLTAITFLVSFVVEVAVIQFISWLLGARGTFTQLAFLMAVSAIPVDVVGSLLSTAYGSSPVALPVLCVLPIYSFALRYVAIRAVHRLTPGPTLLALLPAGVVAACSTIAIYLATFPWPQPSAGPVL